MIAWPKIPLPGSFRIATSLAQAQAWAAIVDAQVGLPAVGTDIGPGLHGVPFVTKTYISIIPHPTQALWAYLSDATTDAALAGQLGLPLPQALDVSWIPPGVSPSSLPQLDPILTVANPPPVGPRAALAFGALAIAAAAAIVLAPNAASSPLPVPIEIMDADIAIFDAGDEP